MTLCTLFLSQMAEEQEYQATDLKERVMAQTGHLPK